MLYELREVFCVLGRHVSLRGLFFKNLVAYGVKQQTRRDKAVGRVFFDVLTRGEDDALAHFFRGNAVVQIFKRCFQNHVGIGRTVQTVTRRHDEFTQTQQVERLAHAVFHHVQDGLLIGLFSFCLSSAFLRPFFAIKHIGAGDFVFARTHQGEFDLILDLLDMNSTALRLDAHQRAHHSVGQLLR